MADFYKKLFTKIKYHFAGRGYGERISRRTTPVMKKLQQKYTGFGGSFKLGKDIATTIFKRITFRD